MQIPDDLIASFPYQFPRETAGKVVFTRATLHVFAELCLAVDKALGENKRGFYWTDTRAGRFKFHVTPGLQSDDLSALCFQAKKRALEVETDDDVTYTNEPLVAKWWAPQESNVPNPEQLIAALPYQFAGKNIGIGFHRGWQGLFSRLCFGIDEALGENKRGFHWIQVKEKWGALRAYHHMDKAEGGLNYAPVKVSEQQPNGAMKQVLVLNEESSTGDPIGKRISDLIDAACEEAAHTCMVCGEPAEIKNLGWVVCLCDHHEQKFLNDRNSLPTHYWEPGMNEQTFGKRWWRT
jgi:hypothetical protein